MGQLFRACRGTALYPGNDSGAGLPIYLARETGLADALLDEFGAHVVGDITYLPIAEGTNLYLSRVKLLAGFLLVRSWGW